MALALAAQPLAAQAKQNGGAAGNGQAAEAAKQPVNETDLLIPDNARAAGGNGAQGGQGIASAVSTWDFVRMLLILAGVVVAIYLLFWLLRRGSGKKIQENDLIRVLGSRSLSGSRALHLVEVGKSVYLVGSSDGSVGLISEVTDKESLDSVRLKVAEETPAARRSFQNILSEIFRPAKKPFSRGDSVGFLRNQRDRLKKL
jgi:flagellar protein FliO/FliZ